MAKPLRPATSINLHQIRSAIQHLTAARDNLRRAGAKRSAAKATSALKSAEGALRHTWRCLASQREALDLMEFGR